MKWQATFILMFLCVGTLAVTAQSSTENQALTPDTQARGYWIDSSTGLMWAGKDNGKDVNWHKAMKYCHDLHLGGYSDWKLAAIDELQGIYDEKSKSLGLVGRAPGRTFTWHVKGSMFLTGEHWSSNRATDDFGHTTGHAWYFNFNDGGRFDDPTGEYDGMRALCVRHS